MSAPATAESAIGLYKTELIRRRGPWRTSDQVEFSTLEYIDWFNNRRLHSEIGYVPPAEFEAAYWAQEPSIAPGSPTIAAPETPLRRSEGLASEPLARPGALGSGSRAKVGSRADYSNDPKEVADYPAIDEIQAPESL